MITALLVAYFLGGGVGGAGGSALTPAVVEQLIARAEASIEDPDRSKTAQLLLRELRGETKSFHKLYARSGRQLIKSYKDHEAERAEALAILDGLNSGWAVSQQRALDVRFQIRGSLTEEEWAALTASN